MTARFVDVVGPRERTHRDIVRHGDLVERPHDLEGAAHAGAANLVRAHADEGLSVEHNVAACRLQGTGDHVEGGGLAGAVRADQRMDGAGRHFEGDVVDGGQPAEATGEPLYLEGGGAGGGGGHLTRPSSLSNAASQGQTPDGRKSTMATTHSPQKKVLMPSICNPEVSSVRSSPSGVRMSAPRIGPNRVPTPPTTAPRMSSTERPVAKVDSGKR